MDFERAVEHLLALHARAEARMEKADARMNRAEARMDRADLRMDRFEKQPGEMWKLMRAGARLVVQIGKAQKETEKAVKRLAQTLSHQSHNGRQRLA